MRALVLSGGGSHGAYQVGVIKRLTDQGRSWDLVSGVSVGALNGLQLAQYAPAAQRAGALALEQFWLEIKGNDSVYRGWFWGILSAIGGAGSMNDTAPLRKLLVQHFDPARFKASGVKFRAGAVALGSGKWRDVDETVTNILDWVMASAAFPAAFPPVAIDGDKWIDGGVRNCTPISDVLDEGATEIDVVLCNPVKGDDTPWDLKKAGNVIDVAIRAATIMADEVFLTDLDALDHTKATVKVYAPLAPWTVDSLKFDPREIRRMIEYGHDTA
jgi:NTE family protein